MLQRRMIGPSKKTLRFGESSSGIREFILYSRKGRTDSNFKTLRGAGRLDIVHECVLASLFLSHGLRRNVVFHALLYGRPSPPIHVEINGSMLQDVRTNQERWREIFQRILSNKAHPGIYVNKLGFEALLRTKVKKGPIYVLEEGGKDVFTVDIKSNPIFVLGDHVGLPKKVERFALRYGEKLSLGKQPYLSASCITILNYILDRKYGV